MEELHIDENDRILIIAPHPDDECIGTGGILALYPKICDVIVMSDGRYGNSEVNPQNEIKIRKMQFEKEMEMAHVNSYEWLGYMDSNLMIEQNCMGNIRFERYTKIFIPSHIDGHPDHTAIYNYSCDRISKICNKDIEVYEYEVHKPFQNVTHYLDITEVIDFKLELIQCHKDQIKSMCYDKQAFGLASYRACQFNKRNSFFETYVKVEVASNSEIQNVLYTEKELQKYQLFFRVLTGWIKVYQNNKNIIDWLIINHIETVSIYGYSVIGKLLSNEILDSDIELIDLFDKKELEIDIAQKKVIKPEAGNRNTECVIVTPVYYYHDIKNELESMGYKNIISLKDIIESISLTL